MVVFDDIQQSLESDKVTIRKKGRSACEEWIRSNHRHSMSTIQTMALIAASVTYERNEVKATLTKNKLPEKDAALFVRKVLRFCIKFGNIKSFSLRHQLLHSIEILEDNQYPVSYKSEHKALLIELLEAKLFHNVPFEMEDAKCGIDRIFKYLNYTMKDSVSVVDSKNLGLLKAVCCSPSRDSEKRPVQLLTPLCRWLDSLFWFDLLNDAMQLNLCATVAECCCGLLCFHGLSAVPIIAAEMRTLFQLSKRYLLLSSKEASITSLLTFLSCFLDSLLLDNSCCCLCLSDKEWFCRYFVTLLDSLCSEHVKVGLIVCAKQVCNRRTFTVKERYLHLWEESGRVLSLFKVYLDCFSFLYSFQKEALYIKLNEGNGHVHETSESTSALNKRRKDRDNHNHSTPLIGNDGLKEQFFQTIVVSSIELIANMPNSGLDAKKIIELEYNLHVLYLALHIKGNFVEALYAAKERLFALTFDLFSRILEIDNSSLMASMLQILLVLKAKTNAIESKNFVRKLTSIMQIKEEAIKRQAILLANSAIFDDFISLFVTCIPHDQMEGCMSLSFFWPLLERPSNNAGVAFIAAACQALVSCDNLPFVVRRLWNIQNDCDNCRNHPLFEWLYTVALRALDNSVLNFCLLRGIDWIMMRNLIHETVTSILHNSNRNRQTMSNDLCVTSSQQPNQYHYPTAWFVEKGHTLMIVGSSTCQEHLMVLPALDLTKGISFESLTLLNESVGRITALWRQLMARVSALAELTDQARIVFYIGLILLNLRYEICGVLANSATGLLPELQEELSTLLLDFLTFIRSKLSLAYSMEPITTILGQVVVIFEQSSRRVPVNVEFFSAEVQARCRNLCSLIISWCQGSNGKGDGSQDGGFIRQRSTGREDTINSLDDEFTRVETTAASLGSAITPSVTPMQQRFILQIQTLSVHFSSHLLSRQQQLVRGEYLTKATYFDHDAYLVMMELYADLNCFEEVTTLVDHKPWQKEWSYLGLLKILVIAESVLAKLDFWEYCIRMEPMVPLHETQLVNFFVSLLFPAEGDTVMIDFYRAYWKVRHARFLCVLCLMKSSCDLSDLKKDIRRMFTEALTDDCLDMRKVAAENIRFLVRLFSKVDAMYTSIRKNVGVQADIDFDGDGGSLEAYRVSFSVFAVVNIIDAQSLVRHQKLLGMLLEDVVIYLPKVGEVLHDTTAFALPLLLVMLDNLFQRLAVKGDRHVIIALYLPGLLQAWFRHCVRSEDAFPLRLFPFEIVCSGAAADIGNMQSKRILYIQFLHQFRDEILCAILQVDAAWRWKLICQYCADCDLPANDENILKVVSASFSGMIATIAATEDDAEWVTDAQQFLLRIVNRREAVANVQENGTNIVLIIIHRFLFQCGDGDADFTPEQVPNRLRKVFDRVVSILNSPALSDLLTAHCNLFQILAFLHWALSMLSTAASCSILLSIASWLCEATCMVKVEGLVSLYLHIIHHSIHLFPECFQAASSALRVLGNSMESCIDTAQEITKTSIRLFVAESVLYQRLLASITEGRVTKLVLGLFLPRKDPLQALRGQEHAINRCHNDLLRCTLSVVCKCKEDSFDAEMLPLSSDLWRGTVKDFRTTHAANKKIKWLLVHLVRSAEAVFNHQSTAADFLVVLHEFCCCVEQHPEEVRSCIPIQFPAEGLSTLFDTYELVSKRKLSSLQEALDRCLLSITSALPSPQIQCIDVFSRASYDIPQLQWNVMRKLAHGFLYENKLFMPAMIALHKVQKTGLPESYEEWALSLVTSHLPNMQGGSSEYSARFILNSQSCEDSLNCFRRNEMTAPWQALAASVIDRNGGYERWMGRIAHTLLSRFANFVEIAENRILWEAVQQMVFLSVEVAESMIALCIDNTIRNCSPVGDEVRYIHDCLSSILFENRNGENDQRVCQYFCRLFVFLLHQDYNRTLAVSGRKIVTFFPGAYLDFEYAAIAEKACSSCMFATALYLMELGINHDLHGDVDAHARSTPDMVVKMPSEVDMVLLKKVVMNLEDVDAIEGIPAEDDNYLESVQQLTRGKYLEALLSLENDIVSLERRDVYQEAMQALGLSTRNNNQQGSPHNAALSTWSLDGDVEPLDGNGMVLPRHDFVSKLLSTNTSLSSDIAGKIDGAMQQSLLHLGSLRVTEQFKAMQKDIGDVRQLSSYAAVIGSSPINSGEKRYQVSPISRELITDDLHQKRVQFGLNTLLLSVKQSCINTNDALQQVTNLLDASRTEREAYSLNPLLNNFWKEISLFCDKIPADQGSSLVLSTTILHQKASLLWMKGSKDIALSKLTQRVIIPLREAAGTLRGNKALLTAVKDGLADALSTAGTWTSKKGSSSPAQILQDYFNDAIALAQSPHIKQRVHHTLAEFCANVHEHLLKRVQSPEWKDGERLLKDRDNELKKSQDRKAALKGSGLSAEEELNMSRHIQILKREIDIDRRDRAAVLQALEENLILAIRHYGQVLISSSEGTDRDGTVFKIVGFWLNNASKVAVNDEMKIIVKKVVTHHFVSLHYQIFSRLGSTSLAAVEVESGSTSSANERDRGEFQALLQQLTVRMCSDHPYHTLPQLLALINEKTVDSSAFRSNSSAARCEAAEKVLQTLLATKATFTTTSTMQVLLGKYIELAKACTAAVQKQKIKLIHYKEVQQRGNRFHECIRELNELPMLITSSPQLSPIGDYSEVLKVIEIIPTFDITENGISRPKIISVRASNGRLYRQLVKGGDDMRQDAVMQQVFKHINNALLANGETRKRELSIRTYKVIPTSPQTGVLEWVENTEPFGGILTDGHKSMGLHSRYFPNDFKHRECREMLGKASDADEKEEHFITIEKNFHPAFRFFFIENFADPVAWYRSRLRYTRSVAANSMAGYVLGIGDRHAHNILIDKLTGEAIHIDFGIVFEQGRVLSVPETVPFRLTRDIVNGMGITGVEGTFRRSCEEVLKLLKLNSASLMTILEVVIHDPLYKWSLSPLQAQKRQSDAHELGAVTAAVGRRRSGAGGVEQQAGESTINKSSFGKDAAGRTLLRIRNKLRGQDDPVGEALDVEAQVDLLINQARNRLNLCRIFPGWAPWL